MFLPFLLSSGLFVALVSVAAADGACTATTIFYTASTDLQLQIASVASSYSFCNTTATTTSASTSTTSTVPTATSCLGMTALSNTYSINGKSYGLSCGQIVGSDLPLGGTVVTPDFKSCLDLCVANAQCNGMFWGTYQGQIECALLAQVYGGPVQYPGFDSAILTPIPGTCRYLAQTDPVNVGGKNYHMFCGRIYNTFTVLAGSGSPVAAADISTCMGICSASSGCMAVHYDGACTLLSAASGIKYGDKVTNIAVLDGFQNN